MTAAPRRQHAVATVAVRSALTGRTTAYVSVDYIPMWQVGAWVRYRQAVKANIAAQGHVDRLYVECPTHPFRPLRKRHRAWQS